LDLFAFPLIAIAIAISSRAIEAREASSRKFGALFSLTPIPSHPTRPYARGEGGSRHLGDENLRAHAFGFSCRGSIATLIEHNCASMIVVSPPPPNKLSLTRFTDQLLRIYHARIAICRPKTLISLIVRERFFLSSTFLWIETLPRYSYKDTYSITQTHTPARARAHTLSSETYRY